MAASKKQRGTEDGCHHDWVEQQVQYLRKTGEAAQFLPRERRTGDGQAVDSTAIAISSSFIKSLAIGLVLGLCGGLTLGLHLYVLRLTGRFGGTSLGWISAGDAVALLLTLACLFASERLRLPSLGIFAAVAVGLPVMLLVAYHWRTGIPVDFQDGAMQTQIVAERLLMGFDPYGTDFTKTELLRWFQYSDGAATPYHFIYFPMVALVAVPVVAFERILGVASDIRPLYLALFAVAFVLVVRLPLGWRVRYVVCILLALDPFFAYLEGRNDILWLLPLVISVAFAVRGRLVLACMALGLAGAVKVFAFPFMLFAAIALFLKWRRRQLSNRSVALALLGLILPFIISVAPFVAWDAKSFWDDTAGWILGSGFPVYGFGLGRALLLLHVLPSPFAPFPFWLVQLALALPVTALGISHLVKRPSFSQAFATGATVLAVIVFCARFTNDNYVASLLFIFALAIAWQGQERQSVADLPALAAA